VQVQVQVRVLVRVLGHVQAHLSQARQVPESHRQWVDWTDYRH